MLSGNNKSRRETKMARPQKYKIAQIADFNRIALLCFNGFLTQTEGAKLLGLNKTTFKNVMDEWISRRSTDDPLRLPG